MSCRCARVWGEAYRLLSEFIGVLALITVLGGLLVQHIGLDTPLMFNI